MFYRVCPYVYSITLVLCIFFLFHTDILHKFVFVYIIVHMLRYICTYVHLCIIVYMYASCDGCWFVGSFKKKMYEINPYFRHTIDRPGQALTYISHFWWYVYVNSFMFYAVPFSKSYSMVHVHSEKREIR